MAKDLLGNELAAGNRVVVEMPSTRIFGYIAEIVEPPMIARANRSEMQPGRIMVSCVIAIPIEANLPGCAQLVRVYDATGNDEKAAEAHRLALVEKDSQQPN